MDFGEFILVFPPPLECVVCGKCKRIKVANENFVL